MLQLVITLLILYSSVTEAWDFGCDTMDIATDAPPLPVSSFPYDIQCSLLQDGDIAGRNTCFYKHLLYNKITPNLFKVSTPMRPPDDQGWLKTEPITMLVTWFQSFYRANYGLVQA